MSLSEMQIHDPLHQHLWDGVQQTLQDDSGVPVSLRTPKLDDLSDPSSPLRTTVRT